jgi:regulator of sigma E protease
MTVITILITVFIFGLVITVHELGHFTAARLNDIKVEKFAIGMGPKIFKWGKGETEYSLRLLPFGGSCTMDGEDSQSESSRAFNKKSVPRKMIVIVAGAAMNILLGLVLNVVYCAMTSEITVPVYDEPHVNSPSYAAGLRPGDEIVNVNGMAIFTLDDLQYKLATAKTKKFSVTVKRGKEKIEFNGIEFASEQSVRYVRNDEKDMYAPFFTYEPETGAYLPEGLISDTSKRRRLYYFDEELGEYVRIAFNDKQAELTQSKIFENNSPIDFYVGTLPNNPGTVVSQAFKRTVTVGQIVWFSLIDLLRGEYGLNEMSGPVGITSVIGQAVTPEVSFKDNFMMVLNILIMITINLGIFNLLPVPALDGGRFVFLTVEGIRGKPIPPEKEGMVHLIGIGALLLLMVVITFNDIRQLFK